MIFASCRCYRAWFFHVIFNQNAITAYFGAVLCNFFLVTYAGLSPLNPCPCKHTFICLHFLLQCPHTKIQSTTDTKHQVPVPHFMIRSTTFLFLKCCDSYRWFNSNLVTIDKMRRFQNEGPWKRVQSLLRFISVLYISLKNRMRDRLN